MSTKTEIISQPGYEVLLLLARNTDNAVVITDSEGYVEWVNDSFTKISGYEFDEIIGKKPGHVLQGEETSEEDKRTMAANLLKKKPFRHEILNYTKGGDKYWIKTIITPIFDEQGNHTQWISIQLDITEKREKEEHLKKALKESEEAQKKLQLALDEQERLSNNLMLADLKYKTTFKLENNIGETLNRAKDELKLTKEQLQDQEKMASLGMLAAGIAHEMNNPVNFVSNGVYALANLFDDQKEMMASVNEILDEHLSPEGKKAIKELHDEFEYDDMIDDMDAMIEDIQTGVKRTLEIVKGLTVFARSDENEQQQIVVTDLIESTLILLKNKYKHRIEVEREYVSDLKPISCYAGPLNQVLVNLVNNAIQAIPEDRKDGKLTIKVKQTEKQQSVHIIDNGTGIPKSAQQKIFEPFFTTKPVGVGTGLGMPISKEIVEEKHGGSLTFNTEEGKGTEFIIILPLTS